MRIIPRNTNDLLSGLLLVRKLDRVMKDHWKPRLERWQRFQLRAKGWHELGNVLLLLAGIISSYLFYCSVPSHFYGSFNWFDFTTTIIIPSLTLACLLFLFFRVKKHAKKLGVGVPAFRPAPDLYSLTETWWAFLQIQAEKIDLAMAHDPHSQYGAPGEERLMKLLKESLPNAYFAVRGSKAVERLDNDVLLFGPNGIWVLESKYFNGEVHYDKNGWYQIKHSGKDQSSVQEKPVGDLDKQWRNECNLVYKILCELMPDWRFKLDGGLVFTHPNVSLGGIDRQNCPVKVDTIQGWINRIKNTPTDPVMTENKLLEALDCILTVSLENTHETANSSIDLSRRLYQDKVNDILSWRTNGKIR